MWYTWDTYIVVYFLVFFKFVFFLVYCAKVFWWKWGNNNKRKLCCKTLPDTDVRNHNNTCCFNRCGYIYYIYICTIMIEVNLVFNGFFLYLMCSLFRVLHWEGSGVSGYLVAHFFHSVKFKNRNLVTNMLQSYGKQFYVFFLYFVVAASFSVY